MRTSESQRDPSHRASEARRRITEEPLTTCEACGGTVRRLLSPAPFILKGGGWYVTDYPSESRKKAMQSEKSSSSPETPSATKSDGAKSDGAKSDGGSTSSSTSSGASSPASSKSD